LIAASKAIGSSACWPITAFTRCARPCPSNAVSPSPCSGATAAPCMCARPRVPSRGIKRLAPSSSSTPTSNQAPSKRRASTDCISRRPSAIR
jgi:hypothetical protein